MLSVELKINSFYNVIKIFYAAKAQKEKENLKKAEAELERVKQEKIKQDELAKQRELVELTKSMGSAAQPKLPPTYTQQTQLPMRPAQQVVNTTSAPSFKPKEMAEKQTIITPAKSAAAPSQSQPPSFGFGAATAEKSTSGNVPSIVSSKTIPSDTPATAAEAAATTTASPFSFGSKTDTSNMFGTNMTASPLFSFGSGAGSGGSVQKTPTTGKVPLLLTPTATNSAPVLNPAATSNATTKSINLSTAKDTTNTAAAVAAASPLSTASTANVQAAAKSAHLSTPAPTTVTAVAAAIPTSNTPKFDLRNSFNSGSDKSADNKENSAPISAAPISTSKTSSMHPFSFAVGNSNSSIHIAQPPSQSEMTSKSITSSTTTSALATALASTPSPVAVTATATSAAVPSSVPNFSFAEASAKSSIFGGASTNITAATTSTATASNATTAVSSSTDPSQIFQNFNICKPTVADSSNSKTFFEIS